ncbi:MAG: cupin-like domain-containing protein [Pseudomonadales bacterium]
MLSVREPFQPAAVDPARVDVEPFAFNHSLQRFAALGREEVCDLVKRLPEHQVAARTASADTGADILSAHVEQPLQVPLQQALEQLEHANTYILVNRPELDPAIAEIYAELTAELEVIAKHTNTRAQQATMFLFIASPHAVTPFHIDRYSAFLYQLHGRKDVHAWNPWGHDKLTNQQLEAFSNGSLKRTPVVEDLSGSIINTIGPGEGVHIPLLSPHWVKNGDQVSISVSLHFTTRTTQQKLDAMCMNDVLRRWLHLEPTQVGPRANARERIKASGFRGMNRLRAGPGSAQQHLKRQASQ